MRTRVGTLDDYVVPRLDDRRRVHSRVRECGDEPHRVIEEGLDTASRTCRLDHDQVGRVKILRTAPRATLIQVALLGWRRRKPCVCFWHPLGGIVTDEVVLRGDVWRILNEETLLNQDLPG